MKISYLSNSLLSAGAANAVHVMNMCSALAREGHSTTLHACGKAVDTKKYFRSYGVAENFTIELVPQISMKYIGPLLYGARQALRARFKCRSDICYARCMVSAYMAVLLRMRVIIEFHEFPESRLIHILVRRIMSSGKVVRCVATSQQTLEDMRSYFPSAKHLQWTVAHNGATVTRYEVSEKSEKEGLKIGYAGGLRDGNGISIILKLAAHYPACTFHILGGSDGEIAYWQQAQVSTNVIWHGRQEARAVPYFLATCDILLAPYQEGPKTNRGRDTSRWMSPMKMFEYMASGKPLIVSDFPVLREVLNEKFAILVEPHDFSLWCESLHSLIEDEQLRLQMGERAVKEICSKYSWDKRAQRVLAGI